MALDRSHSKTASKVAVVEVADETAYELRQKYTQDSVFGDKEESYNEKLKSLGTSDVETIDRTKPVTANTEEIALKALHIDDDPSLNPWTFRVFFLGFGLSAFGSALATIFLFKPQAVSVSIIFLTIISYGGGMALDIVIPRKGILKWLNPHPFNAKEHLAIVIMSSSASAAALATEVLAAQKLYYNVVPNSFVAVLLLFSSQLLGYGLAGVLRKSLVYPTKMVWPGVLPLSSLIETLHRERDEMKKRFRFFWIVFIIVAVWELFPQYIMTALTGISLFCLFNQNSLLVTNIFGGAAGNEGMGLFSLCLDWQFITTGCFSFPLQSLTNAFIGYIGCIIMFLVVYYGNVWEATKFPFLSQQLFSANSSATSFDVYNQSAILDHNFELDRTALAREGIPFFTATNAVYLLTTNLGVTAAVTHIILFNRDTLRNAFDFGSMARYLKNPGLLFSKKDASSDTTPTETDPHYRMMLAYKEVPDWWYLIILVLSTATAIGCIYSLGSTLPWWGFVVAITISFLGTLFFGAMVGMLGFYVPVSSVVQLLGGYLHPGKPVANMYFVLFGANAQSQALSLAGSLKLGQYGKLSPRCTFAMQIIGTLFGAVINYALMTAITTQQRDILLSIQGTNIWSGQAIQSFNSNAIAFGALSEFMFSIGRTYSWVVLALPLGFVVPLPLYFLHRCFPTAGFDYIVTPIICGYLGYLSVGINSSVPIFFAIGFFTQFFVRKRYPRWFLKYNYLLAAAISGGTELLVFVTTFAVQGASGTAIPFPPWVGNNFQTGNPDFCAVNPALG